MSDQDRRIVSAAAGAGDHRRQVRHREVGGVVLRLRRPLRPAVTAKIPAQRSYAAIEGSDDIRPDAGRVAEARFKTQGCVAAIAASSVLTDLLVGKPANEFRSITAEQISEALGTLPDSTFHAAQLCGDAVAALFLKLV